MATARVRICSTEALLDARDQPTGKFQVVYCGDGECTAQYGVTAESASAADRDAAIQAHVNLRKAAGIDYVGRPKPAPLLIDITV